MLVGIADNLTLAAESADRSDQLDAIARTLWQAHGTGALDDNAATSVAAAIDARRLALAGKRTLGHQNSTALRTILSRAQDRAQLDADRKDNRRTRRIRRALSGRVPGDIAEALAGITAAIAAVFDVIGCELAARRCCDLPIGKIAALAGVCRSTVKNAIRLARAAGLLDVVERRVSRFRNATNLIGFAATPLGGRWKAWLARRGGGGVKTVTGTDYPKSQEGSIQAPAVRPAITAGALERRWRPA